jgi:hypothetical protein
MRLKKVKDQSKPKAARRRLRFPVKVAMPRTGKIILAVLATVLAVAAIALLALEAQGRDPNHCAGCHPIKAYVDSSRSSDFEASTHSKSGVGCLSCHPRTLANELKEQVAYRTGNYRKPLREVKVRQEVCLRCHTDYALMAERTAKVVPNPHKSHLGAVDCRVCHKMHKESVHYCFSAGCHVTAEFEPGGLYYKEPEG